jgi:hypothetical protein
MSYSTQNRRPVNTPAPHANGAPAGSGVQRTVRKRVASLKPSPENGRIYRPVDDDPDIDALAASIDSNGLLEPLLVTEDNFVVSGHRRLEALRRLRRKFVPCRVLRRRRDAMTTDDYVALLREHNRQRDKSIAEEVREALIDINPDEALERLQEQRCRSVFAPEFNGVEAVRIEGVSKRYNISDDKAEHVKYILLVVEKRRRFWPLSVRGVHYPLLNYPFVRGVYWPKRNEPGYGVPQELRYCNDPNSYKATSDLITRLRLNGTIPWKAFDDFTRPLEEFNAHRNVREFMTEEIKYLFECYHRDLLQSQPAHIEVLCEKNTIFHMVQTVTRKYPINTSSGRGFNTIDPWHDLYERFIASGKTRLIIIVLSDYDPEGEMIPIVGGRTLRDDFGVPENRLKIIKAGVTREQVERYGLPPQNFAKDSSSNYDWFLARNGGDKTVWELEALDPEDMLRDLDNVILSLIDTDLYDLEVEAEAKDAAYLEAARKAALEALKGIAD